MEGLLPLVYKVIKKNRIRRHYECLSSGDAISNNISMVEMHPQTHQGHVYDENQAFEGDKVGHHRRYKSVPDFGHGFHSPQMRTGGDDSSSSNQLVRFGSQRMFSCITGGA
ncbi:hypothetical protein RIF29_10742 [Crotalaria pallida]|uniref:Uncharacterized protein n=1 Tax=Crotalaria pallida TaxID=3830 RepID=A0AAN9III7_CROPI